MTGTVITSSRPLALFGGNARTRNAPNPRHATDGDAAVAQLSPVSTWGAAYVLVLSVLRASRRDSFFVAAASNDTSFEYENRNDTIARGGDAREKFMRIHDVLRVKADKPVEVIQMQQSIPTGVQRRLRGDVSMIAVTPIAQYLKQYCFTTGLPLPDLPNKPGKQRHLVLCANSAKQRFMIFYH